jgi:citrate lyase beta subunit
MDDAFEPHPTNGKSLITPIRRALMFVPGDDRHKIEKAAASGVDSIILDCEDGVAASRRIDARETIAAALADARQGVLNFGRSEKLVRVSPAYDKQMLVDDLTMALEYGADGIVLPKVETPEDVMIADIIMSEDPPPEDLFYDRGGGSVGSAFAPPPPPSQQRDNDDVGLIIIIETALGVLNLREIAELAHSIPRFQGIAFGAEDFASSLGAIRTPSGHEIAYGRAAVVVAAKAHGLQAIDMVYLPLDDPAGLAAEARFAREMGYDGKMAIHPKQIAPIQTAFLPTTEEIARARRLIDAFDAHQRVGRGAFQYEGQMVDMPIIRAARNVINMARAAGIDV